MLTKPISEENFSKARFVNVAVPVPGILGSLTYHLPKDVNEPKVGVRVKVPVGKRHLIGVVTGFSEKTEQKTRAIFSIVDDEPVVTTQQLALCEFVANYYLSSLGEVVRLCLPPDTQRDIERRYKLTDLGRQEQPHHDLLALFPKKASLAHNKLEYLGIASHEIEQLISNGFVEQAGQSGIKKSISSFSDNVAAASFSTSRTLTNPQQHAVDTIVSKKGAYLLQGVTGSGKTEVYIQVAQKMLDEGRSVLMVVPEIALTLQLQHHLSERLHTNVVMIHSGLSDKDRREAIFSLLDKKARFVIGARSAVFCPMPNLGLIVIDEEHDASFKQNESPRYNARDVAIWRAQNENSSIILGSATPSLESIVNAKKEKLTLLELPHRINQQPLPEVHVVDLKSRGQHKLTKKLDKAKSDGQSLTILSKPLHTAIEAALSQNQQVMLLLNKRGYASFSLCDACGGILECPHCSVSFTYYKKSNRLLCHLCDFQMPLPNFCPHCNEGPILCLGLGTERVEAELIGRFPTAKIARIDRDNIRKSHALETIINDMRSGNIDILIGTQMIAKGHDFLNVSLVGVILADIALSMPDFRASERAFQLLTQMAGRSGRGSTPGQVYIQTFNPIHPAIRFAKNHDVKGFIEQELEARQLHHQPPFSKSALVRIDSLDDHAAHVAASYVEMKLKQLHQLFDSSQVSILGPAKAPIERLNNRYRYNIYLRTQTHKQRFEILQALLQDEGLTKQIRKLRSRFIVDIDPMQIL